MSTAAQTSAVDRNAILGVSPRFVVDPESVSDAAASLRSFAGDKLAVAFVGGGTDLELGAPPTRLDVVLRTSKLSHIVEYAPSDQIVAVEAGMTLADLQQQLAAQGQTLAIDPPFPERATVGGIVAANAFGPRRARYGSARDLVIGITIVRADGTVARGGGKVVKNVAGFDLPRLFCGSLGTLGLIAEVIFRLHPLPAASATVVFDGLSVPEARALSRSALDARLEPVAVAALPDNPPGRYRLAFRFDGFPPGVRHQTSRLLGVAGRSGERLEGDAAAALWTRHYQIRTAGDVRVKASFAPARLEPVEVALRALAGVLQEGSLILYPTLGFAFASGRLSDARAVASALESARAAVAPAQGSAVLTAAPPALRERVDVWGPTPSAFQVMRRLKAEFDPDSRLAPGRFVGGL